MIFCEVREIGEHFKNAIDHSFIEILGFNVGHGERPALTFVDGQVVHGFGYGYSSERPIEVVFQGFGVPALRIFQAGVLFGIAVQKLDLETAFVVRQDVMDRELQIGADEYPDRFDLAVCFQLLHQGCLDQPLERFYIHQAGINTLSLFFGDAC